MSDPFDDLGGMDDIAAAENHDIAAADVPAGRADLLTRCAAFPLSDYGNGQRFREHFGEDVLFVPRVGWFIWSGKAWEKDDDDLGARRRAQELSDLIAAEVPFIQMRDQRAVQIISDLSSVPKADRTEDQKDNLDAARRVIGRRRSFAETSGNSGRIKNALSEAEVSLAVLLDDLDTDPLMVNTQSGVLKFSTVEYRDEGGSATARIDVLPHDRSHKITKTLATEYDPRATAPLFEAFLERIQPDREMREFLRRWFGLSMTGLPMQKLAFFYGSGANGKSVLVDLMARILGPYAATARIESLTGGNRRGGGDATPDLIPLMGARMVRTSEPDEGQRLQEGLIKELTGGEPIQVRALHSDFVEVKPIFKLTMSGNHKPDIRGTDDGIWRRVMLVPFDVQIPERERDPDLGNKLFEERAGILNWLADGLVDVLECGLAPPDAVLEATKEYREESDPIGAFLTTCCTITADAADAILSKELGDAFNYYLLERGLSSWKPTTVAKQISTKSRQWQHPSTGLKFNKGKSSLSQYTGIRLTDAFKRRFEDAPRDHQGRPIGVSTPAPHPDHGDF